MSLQLVVSNPPKSNRRGRKHRSHKKRRMSAAQRKYFAPKKRRAHVAKHKKGRKRRSHRRGGAIVHKRHSSSRSGGGSGFGGLKVAGLSIIPSMATLKSAGAAVGGFTAVNKATEWLQKDVGADGKNMWRDDPDPKKFPWKTVGIKVAVASIGGALLGKAAGRELGQSFAIGGMTAAGLDVMAHFQQGQAGIGDGGSNYAANDTSTIPQPAVRMAS